MVFSLDRPTDAPWLEPSSYWPGLTAATRELDPPYGIISLQALAANAFSMLERAGGTSIRVASKSVRVRSVIDAVLALPGFHGILAYTLEEALWLAEDHDDIVIAYPTADRTAIRILAGDERLASRITLMVDSVDQLDLIDSVLAPGKREVIRVCLDLDASFESKLLGHLGTFRSPLFTPADARGFAEKIVARAGFTLAGMMAYEGQIAGTVDRPEGKPVMGATVRWMQRQSARELAVRRAAAVAAVREVAEVEFAELGFVNGGGTGSLESTGAEAAVTEIGAGSGLFGPHLFDHYTRFTPAPAAAFALSVVRKPTPEMATLLGGGWIASGPPGVDRLPIVAWPEGLKMAPREMAGEVQTPVIGANAAALRVGDRAWLRHTKAGELAEHLNEFALVDGDRVVDMLPTYRGEGKAFL
jgi:D-serine deaminase-like pyridoxal phosphate-dependent protein